MSLSPTPQALRIQREAQCGHKHIKVKARAGTGKSTQKRICLEARNPEDLPNILSTSHNNHINDYDTKILPKGTYIKGLHKLGLANLYKIKQPKTDRYVVPNKYEWILRDVLAPKGLSFIQARAWTTSLVALWDLMRANLAKPTNLRAIEYISNRYLVDRPFSVQEASDILQELDDRGRRESKYRVDLTDMLWINVVEQLPFWRTFTDAWSDETQDYSTLMWRWFLQVADGARKFVLLDDRQAIYGFMGADGDINGRILHDMNADEVGALELDLTVCWRCPTSHLDWAREIVPDIQNAPGAKVGSIGEVTMGRIWNNLPQPGDVFLARTNRPVIDMTYQLISRKVDARCSGRDIGVGLLDIVEFCAKNDRDFQIGFRKRLHDWCDRKTAKLAEVEGNELLASSIVDRTESVDLLYMAADQENVNTLLGFKKFVMDMFGDENADNRDRVELSSIHKFKGKEAKNIYILQPDMVQHPKARTPLELLQEKNIDYIVRTRSTENIIKVRDNISKVECVL